MNAATADVFLSYSRTDEPAVRQIQAYLKEGGLATFLDRAKLPAGQPWLPFLEKELGRAGAVAVFLGQRMGSWQHREVQAALDRQGREHDFPVIPILLPGLDDEPKGFLRLQTWIDLRADPDDPVQLRNLIAAIHREPPEGVAAIKAICPYRGLLPFREEDATFFFGRDGWIEDIAAKVQAHPLVAAVGRSGSGKSSLVFAGLFPRLRRSPGGTTWDMLAIRPGHEPLSALAEALSPPPDGATPAERIERINADADRLRRGTVRVDQLVRHHLDQQPGTDRLLLYVDQWEELYTLAAQAEGAGKAGHHGPAENDDRAAGAERATEANRADVTRFIDLLLAAGERDKRLAVVLTVRADFYDHLLRHPTLARSIQGQQVNLGPMTRAQLRQCIEGPAAAIGLSFEGTLVERILDDVGEDEGKLPLLEYALRETWDASRKTWQNGNRLGLLTFSAYDGIGEVSAAIGTRAELIYERLDEAQRQAARRLFVSLVTPGEGQEDTRAWATVPDEPTMAEVVREFSDPAVRLLVTGWDQSRGERLAEVSHEALIRNWGTLRSWIAVNREILRTRERIRRQMKHWEQERKPDDLLLQRGRALEEGRKLLADHGDVLIDEVQSYIAASLAADEERQREAEAAAEAERQRELAAAQRLASERLKRAHVAIGLSLVALLLAVGAGWLGLVAQAQTRLAINITAGFVQKAVQLNDFGVPRSAIEELLMQAETGFEQLQKGERSIEELLTEAETAFEQLQKGERLPELRSAQAWLLMAWADHYDITGKTKKQRLDMAERGRDSLKELVTEYPRETRSWQQLAFSHDLVGDILADPMERDAALAEYRASQEIRKKLSTDNPNDPDFERDLSISNSKIGDMLFRQGHLEKALGAFRSALKISERLARDYPENLEWKRDELVINHKIGDVLTSDLPAALDHYQRSLEIAKQLITVAPSNIQLRYDLSTSYQKVGSKLEDQDKMHEALNAYRTSLDIANELTACDPANSTFQHATALGYENVGRVLLNQEGPQAALDYYQRSLEICKKLADVDPSTTKLRDVFEGHNRIGELLEEGDQRQDAIAAYQASREIAQQLADSDPENADWRYLLYRQSGRVRQLEKDNEGARHMYCQAKNIAMMNSALNPADRQWKKRLDWLQQHLEDIQGSGGCPV